MDITRVTAIVAIIAVVSCAALFRAEMVDMKNQLRLATGHRKLLENQLESDHAQMDVLRQHVTDLQQIRAKQPQPRPRVAESERRLDSSGDDEFVLADYVRKLKSLPHPAGVDLSNNDSFVLFGQPVDYALSRTHENLMIAGKQFFVQGEFKASGRIMLPYYTRTVLDTMQPACDAKDPDADAVACSLLSYSKLIAVEEKLVGVAADLQQFQQDQARARKDAKNESMAYTDHRKVELENYADNTASMKAINALQSAKGYTDDAKQTLQTFATTKADEAEKAAKGATAQALLQANNYTDQSKIDTKKYVDKTVAARAVEAFSYADKTAADRAGEAQAAAKAYTDQIKKTLESFANKTASDAQAVVAERAIAQSLLHAKNYTDESNADAKKYADQTATKKADAAEATAKAYTDQAKQDLETFATLTATTKAGDAQKAAEAAAAEALLQARNYTDQTKTDTEKYAYQTAIDKADNAQVTAIAYAAKVDVKVIAVGLNLSSAKTDLSAQVVASEITSKAYTDTREIQARLYSLETAFPIGSIYITYSNQEPKDYFPGTAWERVAGGRTLMGVVAATDNTNYGSYNFKTAGVAQPENWKSSSDHTLTMNQMPSHTHDETWRWACDQDTDVNPPNSKLGCDEHGTREQVSYIDHKNAEQLSGIEIGGLTTPLYVFAAMCPGGGFGTYIAANVVLEAVSRSLTVRTLT